MGPKHASYSKLQYKLKLDFRITALLDRVHVKLHVILYRANRLFRSNMRHYKERLETEYYSGVELC
jgi:hypothetical protein